MLEPRLKYARCKSLIPATFDLDSDGLGKAHSSRFFHAQNDLLDAFILEADLCQIICQRLNRQSFCAFGMSLKAFAHRAVIDAVYDTVAFRRAACIREQGDIDQN